MATFRKRANGWQAEVRRKRPRPFYQSATFPTKGQAQAWAAQIEADIHTLRAGGLPEHSFADALERYGREVSPTKRGEKWEAGRIALMREQKMALRPLASLGGADWAAWRDGRLAEVSAGTVLREWNLFSHVYSVAIKEWGWARENPLRSVRRPPAPAARERIPTDAELERLAVAFGNDLTTATGRVWAAARFAIETAMRAGEIVNLAPGAIVGRVAHLAMTKNGTSRQVPLSPEALAILASLPPSDPLFGLSSGLLDALWRKCCKRALVENLHFHDLRALAVTRLAAKLDILTLARMVGHKDLRMLQVYYRESADDIAGKL